jgi:hypothetical protein
MASSTPLFPALSLQVRRAKRVRDRRDGPLELKLECGSPTFNVKPHTTKPHVLSDTRSTLYQRQFADIEEYVRSQAGKSVNTGPGDTGATKFKPIILRCAPFYQASVGCEGNKKKPPRIKTCPQKAEQ